MPVTSKVTGPSHTTTPFVAKSYNRNTKVWTQYASGTYNTGTTYKSTSGYSIPGFSKLKREGRLLPHTPFKQIEYQIEGTGAYHLFDGGVTEYKYFDVWVHNTDLTFTVDQAEGNIAPIDYGVYVQAAAAKAYSTWDALTFLAEWKQTKEMFSSALGRLHNATEATNRAYQRKKGGAVIFKPTLNAKIAYSNLKSAQLSKKRVKRLADLDLEYRYGWRPVVSDMKNILEAIDRLRKRFEIVTARSYGSHHYTETETVVKSFNSGAYGLNVETQTDYDIRIRGSVAAKMGSFWSHITFNPVVTAWELIPLSFVWDWFFTVGKSLEAASFSLMADETTSSGGSRKVITRTYKTTSTWANAPLQVIDLKQEGSQVITIEERVPLAIPKTPFYHVNLDAWKVADLVALLAQRVWRLKWPQ